MNTAPSREHTSTKADQVYPLLIFYHLTNVISFTDVGVLLFEEFDKNCCSVSVKKSFGKF